MNNMKITSVLFVCMGNICRSPSAEAVFRHKAQAQGLALKIDSVGTLAAHQREKPDARSQKTGELRGYNFDNIRARKITLEDFETFDLILAMDRHNMDELKKIAPAHLFAKVHLFLDYTHNKECKEVPDPYYGGANGFDWVLDLIEQGSDSLIRRLS
jgi:protein-tyrosine phosphatase